jgi:adenylate cyclase
MSRRTRERLLVSGLLALAVGLVLTIFLLLNFFATAQDQSHDGLFKVPSGRQAQATTIVGIDQCSYRELVTRYGAAANWPRTIYAQALESLRQASPRVVVFDIIFEAPRPDDPDLAAAMQRSGNVILAVEAQDPRELDPDGVQRFAAFSYSTPALRTAAAAEGLVNVSTDRDTVVRRLPLLLRAGDQELPALSLAAVARYIRRPSVVDAPPTSSQVYAASRTIPVADGRLLINFLGPPSSDDRTGPFSIISLVDVLHGNFDRALVNDRIVLIGLTIRGRSTDEFATPSTGESRMWGVELQANAVETILGQHYLLDAPTWLTVLCIFGLALLAAQLAALRRPLYAAAGTLGLFGCYLLTAFIAVDNGLLLNLIYPPAALLIGFAIALTYRVVSEQGEQELLRTLMSRYLSPSVSQWVLHDPDRLRLGGQTRDMTVLFSDVRGFTTISHRLDPQALVGLLNEYMTAMTEVVFRHDGVLDKYIGDAIMAFWNAPMNQADHAARACATALDMVERLAELQADWRRRGVPPLELGIGVNTGPMVVGNMGSRQRLAYTVLGDTVNVASRLEGLSKEYRTHSVIGVATREAAGPAFVFRFLDLVAVVGRDEPLAVYEVVGRAEAVAPERLAFLADFQGGIELYRSRAWTEAAAIFADLLARAPDDGPSALYLRRATELAANPPPTNWDGVFVATTK